MSKVRKIDFSPDEFLLGVAGLGSATIGVYWVLCSLMYSSGGAIPRNDPRLKSILGDHGNTISAAIKRLIDLGKIEEINGGDLVQKRVGKELENARKRIANAQENGWKGGRKRGGTYKNQTDTKPAGLFAEKLSHTTHHTPLVSVGSFEPEKPKTEPDEPPVSESDRRRLIFEKTGHWSAEWGPRPETQTVSEKPDLLKRSA